MKIDDSLSGIADIRSIKQRIKRGQSASTESAGHPPGESVEFTAISSQLSTLEDTLNRMETTDAGKVEAMQQAIANGQFNVDGEVVADALIQNSIEHMKYQGKK